MRPLLCRVQSRRSLVAVLFAVQLSQVRLAFISGANRFVSIRIRHEQRMPELEQGGRICTGHAVKMIRIDFVQQVSAPHACKLQLIGAFWRYVLLAIGSVPNPPVGRYTFV
jgi:hypothetical protein